MLDYLYSLGKPRQRRQPRALRQHAAKRQRVPRRGRVVRRDSKPQCKFVVSYDGDLGGNYNPPPGYELIRNGKDIYYCPAGVKPDGGETGGDEDQPEPELSKNDQKLFDLIKTTMLRLLASGPLDLLNSVPDPDSPYSDGRVFIDPTMRDEELNQSRVIGGISASTAQKRIKKFKSSVLPDVLTLWGAYSKMSKKGKAYLSSHVPSGSSIDMKKALPHFLTVSLKTNYGKSEAGQEYRDVYNLAKEMRSAGADMIQSGVKQAISNAGEAAGKAVSDAVSWASHILSETKLPDKSKPSVRQIGRGLKSLRKGKFNDNLIRFFQNLPDPANKIFDNYVPSSTSGMAGLSNVVSPVLSIGFFALLLYTMGKSR